MVYRVQGWSLYIFQIGQSCLTCKDLGVKLAAEPMLFTCQNFEYDLGLSLNERIFLILFSQGKEPNSESI
jgi:hypothetical protein